MNITNEQLKLILDNPKLSSEILAYDDFSNTNFSNLDQVSDIDLIRLKDALIYAITNWSEFINVYENPPLMEMEPNPIYIYKTSGLFMVHENGLIQMRLIFS